MTKINILSAHIADLIAAGEVVERPASVAKELLENAIDAGAKAVTVEIMAGGLTYIRVSDDGCGMSEEDAARSILRHATSKIRSAADLEAIHTLGFRGEALAAISAVSRMSIMTKPAGQEIGVSIEVESGKAVGIAPAGCPDGTTVIVKDLFFNTPARLKFMKKDSAEASAVGAVVTKTALSHPEISIKYIKGGKEELHSPGDNVLLNCIYSVMGRDFALGLLPLQYEEDGITISGYISSPVNSRGNRSCEHFFVNGRQIKSASLAGSLEAAYKNRLMSGRFPGCVLCVTVSPAAVDVNVHPAKTEVKFFGERRVFDAVYRAAKNALDGEGEERREPAARRDTPPSEALVFGDAGSAGELRAERQRPAGQGPLPREPAAPAGRFSRRAILPRYDEGSSVPPPDKTPRQAAFTKREAVPDEARFSPREEPLFSEGRLGPDAKGEAKKAFRLIGEAMTTYIVVETEDRLLLIDKHAAHERILFDKLVEGAQEVMQQTLLTPESFKPAPGEADILFENLELLEKLGFVIEDFGGGTILVREAPADVDIGEVVPLLTEIAEALAQDGGRDLKIRKVYESMACKAAVKAGRNSEPEQLRLLAEKVLSGSVRYCPHGRPVAVALSGSRLNRMFGRE